MHLWLRLLGEIICDDSYKLIITFSTESHVKVNEKMYGGHFLSVKDKKNATVDTTYYKTQSR